MSDIKPLPKSLHTVTAVVNVARFLQKGEGPFKPHNEAAVTEALSILGYDFVTVPDPHRLAAKAVAALKNLHLMGKA